VKYLQRSGEMKSGLLVATRLNALKINHRNWCEALESAYFLMIAVSPGEVICITGPSRAGKSKLINELKKIIESEHSYEDTGLMPVVIMTAANTSTNGRFSTKSFTRRMLNAVNHPFHKYDGATGITSTKELSEDTCRDRLESALAIRGVKYLIIDEAQHARYVSKDAQGSYAVMDSWKCLAETAGLVLIIVGAYPILPIINNSPHMIGRKYSVELGRYKYNKEDISEFALIVKAYGEVLEETELLMENIEFFYRGSMGCIGLLRRWIIAAVSESKRKRTPLCMKNFVDSIMPDRDLREVSLEIRNGEEYLQSKFYEDTQKSNEPSSVTPKATKKKPKGKPGNRKPARYEINNLLGEKSA